jgi:hypothetical protein
VVTPTPRAAPAAPADPEVVRPAPVVIAPTPTPNLPVQPTAGTSKQLYPNFNIRNQAFGSEDLEKTAALRKQIETTEKLAELKAREFELLHQYRDRERERLSSTSSESSNYDTPNSSPQAKTKGKLKKNIDHVTNALAFSFSKGGRSTRSSIRKKDGEGWPPKS